MNVNDLRKHHPFPWRSSEGPDAGQIRVLDAQGNEIPILVMTDFIVGITTKLAEHPVRP